MCWQGRAHLRAADLVASLGSATITCTCVDVRYTVQQAGGPHGDPARPDSCKLRVTVYKVQKAHTPLGKGPASL
ncbi:hypothetical protein EDB85DRAFT_1940233 [Lactarius pseudohatsudake]|nr:hypothetical protein EDB85DRAFT_1940233 [Lactarius pseudohatsudake]